MPSLSSQEAQRLERQSETLRVVADEKRLKILHLLARGELCVCKIMEALSISQGLASHHLGVLREAGLVSDRRDARWVYYSLNANAIRDLAQVLRFLTDAAPSDPTDARACEIPGCEDSLASHLPELSRPTTIKHQ